MTTTADLQIVPRTPAAAPALRAADRGVADALEAILADNTRRVYAAQWRLFNDWCDSGHRRATRRYAKALGGSLDIVLVSQLRCQRP